MQSEYKEKQLDVKELAEHRQYPFHDKLPPDTLLVSV